MTKCLVCVALRSLLRARPPRLGKLVASLHHSQKALDPIGLLAVCLAELLESVQQLRRRFAAILDLLFDFIHKGYEFPVNSNNE